MADIRISFDLKVPSRLARWGAAALLVALSAEELTSESLTLQAYYPSPLGIYSAMTTTGATTLARDGGSVGIGTNAPAASAALDVSSTKGGFLPPRMDTAARDAIASPADGLVIFNTSTRRLEWWDNTASAWVPVGGGAFKKFAGTISFPYTAGVQKYAQADAKCATNFGSGARVCFSGDFMNGLPPPPVPPVNGTTYHYNTFSLWGYTGPADDLDCLGGRNQPSINPGTALYWDASYGLWYPEYKFCANPLTVACCN